MGFRRPPRDGIVRFTLKAAMKCDYEGREGCEGRNRLNRGGRGERGGNQRSSRRLSRIAARRTGRVDGRGIHAKARRREQEGGRFRCADHPW
jgi:hypothetical protein